MVKVSFEQLVRVRDFIKKEIGIKVDDYKLTTIYKRKLVELINNLGFKSFDDFFKQVVKGNQPVVQELYSLFTVNETYFFREKEQFELLVNTIIPEIIKTKKGEDIHILSAPCSTGEEAYSIAIYLMERGYTSSRTKFTILGIDVDPGAIKKAEEGFFTDKSMRDIPDSIKEKYFVKTNGKYRVIDTLKDAVSFRVANVVDRYGMRKLGRFDVIYSRNMLIYFDEKLRNETIATFYSILKPEGYLFLGHAERMPEHLTLFKPKKVGKTVVYQKIQ